MNTRGDKSAVIFFYNDKRQQWYLVIEPGRFWEFHPSDSHYLTSDCNQLRLFYLHSKPHAAFVFSELPDPKVNRKPNLALARSFGNIENKGSGKQRNQPRLPLTMRLLRKQLAL
jgi:hypothetical protein